MASQNTEPPGDEIHRTLTGWLAEDEGIQFLLGRAPTPEEDLTGLRERLANRRQAVASREPFREVDAVVAPADPASLEAIAARPDLQAAFSNLTWQVAMVDLGAVLSAQKAVRLAGIEERVSGVGNDLEALLALCLPSEQPSSPARAFADVDGKGVTMSSSNPNLRLAGMQVVQPAGGAGSAGQQGQQDGLTAQQEGLMVVVQLKTSYLQVAHYQGRYFLVDGYHRAAGLLRSGITVVPSILFDADSFEQVLPTAGLFSYETVFGERPPRLVDFWDATVSDDVSRPSVRKVIRVRGDEFVVEG